MIDHTLFLKGLRTSKTIPYLAARTYIAHIWEYPLWGRKQNNWNRNAIFFIKKKCVRYAKRFFD